MKRERWQGSRVFARYLGWVICAGIVGCVHGDAVIQQEAPIPRELQMTTLPPYVIEPPDILIIRATNIVPKPPYRIQPLDAIYIQVTGTLPEKPISGAYGVEPDGKVNLGIDYGTVRVAGMTIEEAQKAIYEHLKNTLKEPRVQVSLASSRGLQQIQGDHLVRMDGTIGLGVYGSVYVTGLTIDQARRAIEEHLSQTLLEPEISLDVYAYNSKWYYIVMDRAGYGQTVVRLPITGRDTVLDAMSQMFGTLYLSSNRHIWLARPNGADPNKMQIFPINWPALTQGGSPATNYQLLPGDRIFVKANPLVNLNNRMAQFFAPMERVFGITLLGTSTVSSIAGTVNLIRSGSTGAGLPGSGVGVVR